jgi:hypothetical protein
MDTITRQIVKINLTSTSKIPVLKNDENHDCRNEPEHDHEIRDPFMFAG